MKIVYTFGDIPVEPMTVQGIYDRNWYAGKAINLDEFFVPKKVLLDIEIKLLRDFEKSGGIEKDTLSKVLKIIRRNLI